MFFCLPLPFEPELIHIAFFLGATPWLLAQVSTLGWSFPRPYLPTFQISCILASWFSPFIYSSLDYPHCGIIFLRGSGHRGRKPLHLLFFQIAFIIELVSLSRSLSPPILSPNPSFLASGITLVFLAKQDSPTLLCNYSVREGDFRAIHLGTKALEYHSIT